MFCFLGIFYLGGCVGGHRIREPGVGQAEDAPLEGSTCWVEAEGVQKTCSVVKVGLGKGSRIPMMQGQAVICGTLFLCPGL